MYSDCAPERSPNAIPSPKTRIAMHFMKMPRRQNQHLPQETKNEPTTRSPSSNWVTPAPLSSIVPMYSWPRTKPSSISSRP